ncbi:MAG: hypothetical protein EPO21_22520 [Chloroflexota bacterium]|nr:MAG: hypothetical protein EPO21_22520 [Chloroflexota bacterium]
MESRSVLILYKHQLFAAGAARLFQERGYGLVAIDACSKGARRRVQSLKPHVILVEDDDGDGVFATRLGGILKASQNGVIRVHHNQISVYSSRHAMVTGPEDLFEAIESLIGRDGEHDREQQPMVAQ